MFGDLVAFRQEPAKRIAYYYRLLDLYAAADATIWALTRLLELVNF
ncbi:MAG: hypothetical protein R3B90_16595 [Planctomycetaceae bacterium]